MTFEQLSNIIYLCCGVIGLIGMIMVVFDHSRRIKRLEDAVFHKLGKLLYGEAGL